MIPPDGDFRLLPSPQESGGAGSALVLEDKERVGPRSPPLPSNRRDKPRVLEVFAFEQHWRAALFGQSEDEAIS